ncbi:MAG TPA: 3,4-dihydroxy-2-butanone-4-phosphate synthase, partial [Lysinibacillus sp.]|nr:3,4-dihydroxy-2-butanone-4-phosphate synthase [Lysinibacillus sp.]
DDGHMLRFEELIKYAAQHDLKMISIEALVAYRSQLLTTENKISI